MGKTTISWTATPMTDGTLDPGYTFNPWWGCQKVSEGCRECYASTFSKRVGQDHLWGPNSSRRMFGDKHWAEPVKWNRKAEKAGVRKKVFCGSMCDWAEDRPDLVVPRQRLVGLVDATPWLIWLLLTKRTENILRFMPDHWKANPPANVWMGTTTENQEMADVRIPTLLQVPAVVRFLSIEPMVGPIQFADACNDWLEDGIHWCIVGGESGAKARPMSPLWARSLRDQCKDACVPFLFKQWGTWAPCYELDHDPELQARILDGRVKEHDFGVGEGGERLAYYVGKDKSGDTLDGERWHQFPKEM